MPTTIDQLPRPPLVIPPAVKASKEVAGFSQELLDRRRARASLIGFAEFTNPLYVAARHHMLIADGLERISRREIDRLMIAMPPRHGKSELASRRFPAWYLGRHPDHDIIAASYNSDLAGDFGREVRNIFQTPDYAAIFPHVSLAPDSQAANRWHTVQGGGYVAAGVGTAVTGRGAHVMLVDDPLRDREQADSAKTRDRVWDWYTSTAYTRLAPGGAIVLIMTRWHADDLAGRLLAAQDEGADRWEILTLPAIAHDGSALWPDRYPVAALGRIQNTIGDRDWQALYQQRPSAPEGGILKRAWWQHWTEPSFPADIAFTVLSLDGAYTEKTVNDASACTVWQVYIDRQTGGTKIILRHAWQERLELYELVALVAETARHFKARKLLIEAKANGLSVIQELRRRFDDLSVHPVTPKGDKVARAYSVQPMLEHGSVYVPCRADAAGVMKPRPWAQDVIDQCASFPAAAHDDLVDSTTQALRYLRESGIELFTEDQRPAPPLVARRARY